MNCRVTGKSLSEALIFASTNPQYDDRLFIELQVRYIKIPSSNLGRTCSAKRRASDKDLPVTWILSKIRKMTCTKNDNREKRTSYQSLSVIKYAHFKKN